VLIKPGGACHKPLHRRSRDGDSLRAELVAQNVKPLLDPPDERLVRGLLQPQRSSRLIHFPHRLPQRPARGRQHEEVIHIPDVPPAALCHLHIQRIQIGLTQQTA